MAGKNIKKLRVSLKLSQQEFADKLKTSQATVSSWEAGSFPRAHNLDKLLKLAAKAGFEWTIRNLRV